MNRRAFFGMGVTASLGLTGCLSRPNNSAPDEEDSCPSVLSVVYNPRWRSPEEAHIPYRDAEADGLMENEYLAEVLSDAQSEYEERNGDFPRHMRHDIPLLRNRELAESDEVPAKLGLDRKNGMAFVEYDGVVYRFDYGTQNHSRCTRGIEGAEYSCPNYGSLSAFIDPETSLEDRTVLDAEDDQLTENEHISNILEAAHTEYENRDEEELHSPSGDSTAIRLAREQSEELMYAEDIATKLGGSESYTILAFVEYKGVTYQLTYSLETCD